MLIACAALLPAARAHSEVTFAPSWEMPTYETVRGNVLQWLDEVQPTEEVRAEASSLWPSVELRDADGTALLQRVAETFAVVDPQAHELVRACNLKHAGPLPPDASWLHDRSVPRFMRHNLLLYYARWLAQRGLYDEVLLALEGISAQDVVDPAGLLFTRVIAHQQLVHLDESRAALAQLLEHEETLPRRYEQIAQLLQRDLAELQDESLDHIARQMNDVRRRLDFGRAGKKVQSVEQSVVDSLDKLIKKIEDQQQQCSKSGGTAQSSQPMQDSRLPSMRAPMQVDQRDIGSQSGWGDLPPRERQQALQQIGRDFPAHYRELIEQYFRELADESNSSPNK